MDLRLRDRVVLVSGATRGIGRAIAEGFLAEGARVALTGRGAADLESARGTLEQATVPGRVTALQADMTYPDVIARVCDEVVGIWGRIDIAVANVGSGTGKPLLESDAQDWQEGFRTNLLGAVELARVMIPRMQAEREGVLLFISSIVGVEAIPAPLPYVAAKSALHAFGKNLARAVASDGIRVNILSPGNVVFPGGGWARKLEEAPDHVAAYIEREVPMKRFGTPREIADIAVFMCSPRAGFMTGACVVVDGGQTRSY